MQDLLDLSQREQRSLLVAFADIYGYTRKAMRTDDLVLADDLDA